MGWNINKNTYYLSSKLPSPLDPWLNHGGIGLMGRPCTHESLGWKQGNPGGLVVQTPGAMWGGRGRARRAPRAHQGRARSAPCAHRGRARRTPRASQTCTERAYGRARHAPRAYQMGIARAPDLSGADEGWFWILIYN